MAIATTNQSDLVPWLAGCLGRGDLAPLSCDDLEEFAGHLTEHRFAGGTAIYERDAAPDRVHIVHRGMVELTRDLGGRSAVVQLLRPGSVFGDVPMFLRTGELTAARAVEDGTVLSIDSVTLFGLLSGSLDRQVGSWLQREGRGEGVTVSQLTLARLLGARRTSVNQSLRRLEAAGYISTGYRRITVVDPGGLAEMLASR